MDVASREQKESNSKLDLIMNFYLKNERGHSQFQVILVVNKQLTAGHQYNLIQPKSVYKY